MSETEAIILKELREIKEWQDTFGKEQRLALMRQHAFNPAVKELDIEHLAVYSGICRSDLELAIPHFPELTEHRLGKRKKMYSKADLDGLKANKTKWQQLNDILNAKNERNRTKTA